MGRQITVSFDEEDEQALLAFLRQSGEIQILDIFTPTKEALFVADFAPPGPGHYSYTVWNRHFSWEPEFALSQTGDWYIANTSDAPVIEYSRPTPSGQPGRLYWGKYFAAPGGLGYDVAGFEDWFESVLRWVRRRQKKKSKQSGAV